MVTGGIYQCKTVARVREAMATDVHQVNDLKDSKMKNEAIQSEFHFHRAGFAIKPWYAVRLRDANKGLGYVAKLDELQSHGSRRSKGSVRANSWWVASTDRSNRITVDGDGKFATRNEAANALKIHHGL